MAIALFPSFLLGISTTVFPLIALLLTSHNTSPHLYLISTFAGIFYLIPAALGALPFILTRSKPADTVTMGIGEQFFILILPAVVFQLVFRYLYVRIYRHCEDLLATILQRAYPDTSAASSTPLSPSPSPTPFSISNKPKSTFFVNFNDTSSSLAAGTGYGAMHSLILCGSFYSSTVTEFESSATGGTNIEVFNNLSTIVQLPLCSSVPTVYYVAFVSLFFGVMDVCSFVILFSAISKSSGVNLKVVLSVGVIHLLASAATLFNKVDDGCYASIPIVIGVSFGCFLVAFKCLKSKETLGGGGNV